MIFLRWLAELHRLGGALDRAPALQVRRSAERRKEIVGLPALGQSPLPTSTACRSSGIYSATSCDFFLERRPRPPLFTEASSRRQILSPPIPIGYPEPSPPPIQYSATRCRPQHHHHGCHKHHHQHNNNPPHHHQAQPQPQLLQQQEQQTSKPPPSPVSSPTTQPAQATTRRRAGGSTTSAS